MGWYFCDMTGGDKNFNLKTADFESSGKHNGYFKVRVKQIVIC